MTRISRVLLILVLGVALGSGAACRKKAPLTTPPPPPPPPAAPAPPPPPPPPAPTPTPAPAAPLTEEQIFAQKSLDQLNAEKPLGTVYFDYDKYNVRDSDIPTLQKNADWLRKWPATRITVEGHCDPRGTAEYNLALGERRAAAVKSYLVSLGVATDRVSTVSYGKERLACTEENEACWSRDRRGQFLITGK